MVYMMYLSKKCWHILGDSIIVEVLDVMNNKLIPEGWNLLILKVENPEFITQYRPIRLCTVIYKDNFKDDRHKTEACP